VENVHDESVLSSYPSYSSKQEVEKVEKVDDNKLEVPNTVIRSARLPPRVLGPGLVVVASSRARVIQSFRRIGSSESVLFDEDDVVKRQKDFLCTGLDSGLLTQKALLVFRKEHFSRRR
jgi:hypothetical protein